MLSSVARERILSTFGSGAMEFVSVDREGP